MNVLLLGAGASKSYSHSPSGQQMPLARELFSTFCNLEISQHPWVLLHSIGTYLKIKHNLSIPEFFQANEDIEQFHSEVEEALINSIETGDKLTRLVASAASVQLRFVFTFVLNEIQNGPVSNPHRSIARLLRPEDCVITFNWDTLLDRALSEETAWKSDSGYLEMPTKIYRNKWVEPSPVSDWKGPYLLKLHGSTNWITSFLAFDGTAMSLVQATSPESFYVFEQATKPYPTWKGRYMEGYGPFSYGYYPPNIPETGKKAPAGRVFVSVTPKFPFMPEGTADCSGLVSMPLIIPPVKSKDYELFGNLFRRIWQTAEEALVAADHIVVIGYSFPRTDHKSNQLFLSAFRKRVSNPQVTIINRNPHAIEAKFRLEFGIPASKLVVYEAHFDEAFDLEKIL